MKLSKTVASCFFLFCVLCLSAAEPVGMAKMSLEPEYVLTWRGALIEIMLGISIFFGCLFGAVLLTWVFRKVCSGLDDGSVRGKGGSRHYYCKNMNDKF